jgi:hypothetical protein
VGRREGVAAGVEVHFPWHWVAVETCGIVGLVAVDMFIKSSDVELSQRIADLHINVKVGAQEDAGRRCWLLDEPSSPGEATLVVQ